MHAIHRRRLTHAVRIALLCSVVPLTVQAQDDEDARVLDRIEVTGSRIKRVDIEQQVPVQVISREDIEQTGLTSIGDVIQQITGSGSSLNTKFNSSGNFGFPPDGSGVGAGATTVDLRHLGSKRVLVLVDGLRWVNESSASGVGSATDLNTIPLAIVERIEVLEDGASAIYGSDAIAGVVNIITRRNFDGAQVSAYYGENGEGDGATKQGDISMGGSGDRFDFFIGASYVEQEAIESKDREQARFPVPGTGLTFGSSGTPNGRFIIVDDRCDGGVCDITTPNGEFFPDGPSFPDDFIPFGTANRFNFAEFNLLLTPSERRSVFAQTRFEVSDSTTWYLKALYNRRDSTNRAAPEPIFLGPEAGTGNPYADDIFISADNPYNPFGVDLVSSGPGANLILIGRRPVEGGPRIFQQDVDTWYVATGLQGSFDFGDAGWYWDVNFASSENEANQTNFGSYNIRRIAQALGPLAACNADPQCVPLDIFSGPGSITPDMLAYIQPVVRDYSKNDLQLFSANLSGDLFELPAGPLAFAAGFEHRRLAGEYRPDALTVAGEYNGVPSLPTSGEYDVDEYFVEFNVPVYDAGGSRLDASVAGRYSDYSTFGGETTGKLGLRWQFSDQFLLRGTYAEGFRAPSIGELFGSASRFDAVIDDPCLVGVDGSAPEANCAAFGVPEGAVQVNQQISILTGGNPNLQPETSDSWSAGAVWSPAFGSETGWSQRFDVEFTYYSHEIDGAIQAIDAQTQLDLCVAGGPASVFCEGIARAPTGGISSFNNRLVNIGQIETSGWDFDVFWTLPVNDWGQFKLSWQNTIVEDYEAVTPLGNQLLVDPREPGRQVNDSGIPEWTSNLRLDWSYGDFDAAYTIRHISDMTEDCGDAVSFPVCSDPVVIGQDDEGNDILAGTNHLGSTTYHDFQVAWSFDWMKRTQIAAGVNNIFEKDPPICLSCSLNGYDASNYDVPGRFWYVKLDIGF